MSTGASESIVLNVPHDWRNLVGHAKRKKQGYNAKVMRCANCGCEKHRGADLKVMYRHGEYTWYVEPKCQSVETNTAVAIEQLRQVGLDAHGNPLQKSEEVNHENT